MTNRSRNLWETTFVVLDTRSAVHTSTEETAADMERSTRGDTTYHNGRIA
jgi:hypothetical protein